ncbi:MAG: hypothetical protein CL608_10425 [Anaerolineaceae bacterium]|nr:hypothetical protein [Anaerolineaceae bacterium]
MSEFALTPPRIWSIPRPSRIKQAIQARFFVPPIEADSVAEILHAFGQTLAQPPQNLPLGGRNSSLVLHTSGGKKVLKRYRSPWPAATMAYEHSILDQLAACGFPAPRLNTTPNGETLVQRNGRTYALFDFVEGINVSATFLTRRQRQQLIAQAGATLARLHHQLSGFSPAGEHHLGYQSYSGGRRRDLAWHLRQLAELPEKTRDLPDPAAQWLCQKSDELAEKLTELADVLETAALSRLIIHGDYGLHNLLFHRDGTATVHDFELARLEWRLIDLITVLSRLGDAERRTFMAAYAAEFPLTASEWELLPQVWQYYRLRGAVQYWHNHFVMHGRNRLSAAQQRIQEADWALQNPSKLWQLKAAADQTPRVMMVVRLFYPWVGGTERQAHKLARKLLDKQVAVELVTGWWFRGSPAHETLDGIPVQRNFTLWEFLGIKGLRKFGGYLYILTLLWHLWRRRDDHDVIHVHGLNYHTFTAVLAGRLLNKKVISKLANSGHASDINKMREDRQLALARFMLPTALKCDRFVALNEKVVDELTAVHIPNSRIIELPNGVETDAIPAKTSYDLHTPARLIFVGRLHPQKGIDTLLHAMRQLTERHDVCLHLLGDGPLKEELMDLVEELGITHLVKFHGQTDDVLAHLQEADLFVLPSRAEGLSNALLEAMSCSLPVVVSAIPGNVDVIEHNQNGLRFTVDDPDSLAQTLASLLTNANQRRQLGRQARQTVERHYSLSAVADQYIDLYRDLIS